MNIDYIIEKPAKAISRQKNIADVFRQSQLKESQIVMGGGCCSRHLLCIHNQGKTSPYVQSDSLSIGSDLLQELQPQQINTEPLFQFLPKPQIELLGQINIKKKKFQKIIQQCQIEERQEKKKKMKEKVINDAKLALSRSQKIAKPHPKKWGHSPFTYNNQNQQIKSEQVDIHQENNQKQEKKIQLKPINQRIAQYKQQQLKKVKSAETLDKRIREDINVKQCQAKIKQNADKLLQKMRLQKLQRQEQKRVIQAKIRALQIKSLKKVQISKKKPLQPGVQFQLGDSQYSTFSARANNRKKQKKMKKQKQKPQNIDPSLLQTKKNPKNAHKKQKSVNKTNIDETIGKNKGEENFNNTNGQFTAEQMKGPFYIWNIPITQEDRQKLQHKSQQIFMNVDRFNYKSGKTFREQANEFLNKKMEKKMQQKMDSVKEQAFLAEVAKKKKILEEQFKGQVNEIMNEAIWNEDELFRSNILQNFHFFAKEKHI